jgi:hypothetical protein
MLGQPPDPVPERGDLPHGAASARPPAPRNGGPPPGLDYEALLEALADSGRPPDPTPTPPDYPDNRPC